MLCLKLKMVVHKRKKVTKYRGHTTHGGGSRKKRRGAGSRGGCGNAGTGKRAGHKKAGMKDRTLGRIGFTSKKKKLPGDVVNLDYFTQENIKKLVKSGKAIQEGDYYIINLNKLNYVKLLGSGNTALKLKITVNFCSSQAAEKVKSAGGEVISQVTSSENNSNRNFVEKQIVKNK